MSLLWLSLKTDDTKSSAVKNLEVKGGSEPIGCKILFWCKSCNWFAGEGGFFCEPKLNPSNWLPWTWTKPWNGRGKLGLVSIEGSGLVCLLVAGLGGARFLPPPFYTNNTQSFSGKCFTNKGGGNQDVQMWLKRKWSTAWSACFILIRCFSLDAQDQKDHWNGVSFWRTKQSKEKGETNSTGNVLGMPQRSCYNKWNLFQKCIYYIVHTLKILYSAHIHVIKT